jgi:competence protein ComEC
MQLAFWSSALALGIAFGITTEPWVVRIAAVAGAAALGLLLWLRAWNLAIAALAMVLGIGLGCREAALATAPAPIEEDRMVEVTGQVASGSDVAKRLATPTADSTGQSEGRSRAIRSHLRIMVETVSGRRIEAALGLSVLDGIPDLAPGDRVRLSCRLYLPRGSANPGLTDGRLLARGQGIDLLGTVRASDLQRLPSKPGMLSLARRWAYRLRQAMSGAINNRLSERAAGFVRTMVVGERSEVPAAVEDGFRAAGATHVLSVSGLHLAMVVALVFQGLKRAAALFPSSALRVAPKAFASAVALPVAAFYTLLTGEAVATVRSALMASVVLGAAIVNRPLSLSAGIGAAAMFLLLRSPAALLDVSFQLSFASVIGLGLFARCLLPRVSGERTTAGRRVLTWLYRSLSASLAACLVTMPLVAHHFGEITPAAPLGNLVIVPLVETIVLPFGLVGALLALLHPWLGALPLFVAGLASELALVVAEVFRRCAPVLLVRFPDVCETILLVGAAGCLLQASMSSTRSRRRWLLITGAALALAMTSMAVHEVIRRTRNELVVTFLDVGQGSATLIEGPRGFVALVDGGGRFDDSFDTGARIVEPVLRAAGITRLDLVVLSHSHPDHLNGLLRILERFSVGALWTSGDDGGNPMYGRLLALARERSVPTPVPARVVHAGLEVETCGPWLDGRTGVPPGLSANDASLVIRLSFAGRTLLLPGDIGEAGEAELLDRRSDGLDLSAEVLEIPHHGSRRASSPGFLDAVSPTLAVASAGRFNRFGLPSPSTLERYAKRNVDILRTDRDGAVTVTIDSVGRLRATCVRSRQR